jgi:hypothetical protein
MAVRSGCAGEAIYELISSITCLLREITSKRAKQHINRVADGTHHFAIITNTPQQLQLHPSLFEMPGA